jgi:hypothetical protein
MIAVISMFVTYIVSLFAFWLRVEHRLSVIETKISFLEKQYGPRDTRQDTAEHS